MLPSNYRGIALLSLLSKLFCNLVDTRISVFQDSLDLMAEEQFGFTKDRRAQDPIFILDTLVDYARAEKKKLFVAFIDFQKAYDFVFHDGLFFKMLRNGIEGRIFRLVKA